VQDTVGYLVVFLKLNSGVQQLNADKTEVIWFGSKANLAKLKAADLSLSVGSESIRPVSVVRDLGVLLDAQLSMKQHINKTIKSPPPVTITYGSAVSTAATALPQSTIEPLLHSIPFHSIY